MTTSLLQVNEGAPPHLPGSKVLRVSAGNGDAVLLHDTGLARDVIYARLMVNPSQAQGGSIVITGGIDVLGNPVWQVVVDAAGMQIRLEIGDADVSVPYPAGMDWHAVEVGIDALAGYASLRLNGIHRAEINTDFTATRSAWLGGAFAQAGMLGSIDLDHWVLATEPIGLPIAEPNADHAGDPRRWLLVYNRNDADSIAWTDIYRARRGVPYANLVGLDLPMSETVSAAEYELMRQGINDYLDDNSLRSQVVGVLLGLNVPGYADVAAQGALTPIPSYLHTDDLHGLPVVNPLYQSTIGERPSASEYGGVRLTGRIDAPSLAEAIAMIDRVDALADQPLVHDAGADVLVDINPDNPNVGPVYTQPVADWAAGEGLSLLRLPATVYDAQPPAAVNDEAVVWGWRDAAPPSGFFGSSAGRRAICMQFDPEPTPAVTLRDAMAGDWLSTALQAGYASAAAPSRPYSLSSLPLPHLFFGALRAGWTVAEAWLVAQPFLRDGLQIIGDPLMPIAFPKSGYDVFGPVTRLDLIDFESPLATLHAGERELAIPPEDRPDAGEASRYLVRRLDDQGRADYASAAVFTAIEAGQSIRPAMPAWPDYPGWPVLQRQGRLQLSAYWPASLRSQGIDSVQLVAQVGGDASVILDELTPLTGQRRADFLIDRPAEATQYRFAIVKGGVTRHTPWSAEVSAAAAPTQTLTLLEASS